MKVKEAVKALLELEQEADLVICAHEFEYDEIMGWHVQGFEPTEDKQYVMVEGAMQPGENSGPSETT